MIGAAFQSSALTIGRPAGSAWIGKPLDLVIPLELDRSESGDSLCLEADVLQGDARLDDKRVTLSLDPGPNPDAPRVRLRTTRAVEEPVVTVKLTAGCVAKSTRQYVLLADLPETPPVVASPSRLPLPATAAAAGERANAPVPSSQARPSRSARAAQGAGGAASGSAEVAQASPPRKRAAAVASSAPAPDAVRKPHPPATKPAAPVPSPAAEPKSRLQVDALAPEPVAQSPRPALAPATGAATGSAAAPASAQSVAPPATLAPSAAGTRAPESGTAPSVAGTETAGTPAAAALAAAAEQGRRDADRLKEMENALATLREQSVQNQRQLLELRGSLAQAETDRYRNPVVYALLALLALALVALIVFWRQARSARQAAWWGGAGEEDSAPLSVAGAKEPLPRHGELADDDDDDVDTETNPASLSDVSGLHSAAQGLRVTALPDGVGASAFQGTPVRPVNAEQLLDVQQQAEFFLSLGQHDQAIGVLREHIAASPGTSAMAYLDLLGLLKAQDRRTDYAAVALEFGHGFNVALPEFEQFTGGERGLEHYPEVLLLIVEKWPSQGTADLIEAFIFRKPGSADDVFDLPAYQDLLMLYAVARDLSEYAGPWGVPRELPVAPPPVAVLPGQAEHPYQPTAPMPYLRSEPAGEAPASETQERGVPPLELDLSDLDRTAFETLRAPIEPEQPASKPQAVPSIDPHLIDFDPFDPDPNQAERRPRHLGVKR